jgi:hypothetical protein
MFTLAVTFFLDIAVWGSRWGSAYAGSVINCSQRHVEMLILGRDGCLHASSYMLRFARLDVLLHINDLDVVDCTLTVCGTLENLLR